MIKLSPLTELTTDTWLKATWEEYLELAKNPTYFNGKFYYDRGYLRIEMSPLGSSHGQDNSIVSKVVSLYATLKKIRIKELTNTSFRKPGIAECQPDLAFYIGTEFKFPPRNNAPVDVNEYNPPTLAIEIAATSLNDDLGKKRLLYERLGVKEYWVVDVKASDVIAFAIDAGRSGEIQNSQILPGLAIATVELALHRSQTEDDGEINRWLLQIFSSDT